jgi:carboxylesterase type B
MKLSWLHLLCTAVSVIADPVVLNPEHNVTYQGFGRNGIDVFLGIPYAQDTGGANRFKPPQLYVPEDGTTIDAGSYGPACPQPLGQPGLYPLYLSNITDISEDCLNLNIARPNDTTAASKLPVMVWIHGGSFWSGSNADIVAAPDGLILESIESGTPIVHVGINYRLGGETSLAHVSWC